MALATESKNWISLAEAKRLAVIGRTGLSGLIDSGLISVRSMPGSRPRVRRDELERVIQAATRPATARGCAECP